MNIKFKSLEELEAVINANYRGKFDLIHYLQELKTSNCINFPRGGNMSFSEGTIMYENRNLAVERLVMYGGFTKSNKPCILNMNLSPLTFSGGQSFSTQMFIPVNNETLYISKLLTHRAPVLVEYTNSGEAKVTLAKEDFRLFIRAMGDM